MNHCPTSRWRYWLPPLAWSLVILIFSGNWGSSQQSLNLVRFILSWFHDFSPQHLLAIHTVLRKLAHVMTYGILYFLWLRHLRCFLGLSARQAFLGSMALCLVVACLDEGHQYFLKCRTGSLLDVALDLLGAWLAAGLTSWLGLPRNSPPREALT